MDARHWLAAEIESVPVSLTDVQRMLGHKASQVRVMVYDDLARFGSLERLLEGVDAAIILLQIETPTAPPVGHWIAMLKQGTFIEHFDSYGIGIDEELARTHESPILREMMTDSPKMVIQTRSRLQAKREDVNTCGRWCVARVLSDSMDAERFGRFYRSFGVHPDALVSLVTMFL